MKRYFKISLAAIMMFIILGCNSRTLSNTIDGALIATSSNKPPQFFEFASPYRANGYVMHHKNYSFTMPLTKELDWSRMSGWRGSSDFQGIGFGVDNPNTTIYGAVLGYGINISSSVGEYKEFDRELEKLNENYFKIKYPKRVLKNGKIVGIDQHIEYLGKDNYVCIVSELRNYKRGIYEKAYNCYKFNSNKTKSKGVSIKLIYTKSPNLPNKYKSLAQQYTYQDLQNRAKRTLDSLYIKDGW